MPARPLYPPALLRHHATLAPPRSSDVLVYAAPGPHGELVAVWSDPDSTRILEGRVRGPGGVSSPPSVLDRPVPVRVSTYHPEPVHTIAIADLSLPWPYVQPLPGGRILLVGARSRWHGDRADRNAVIYNSDGGRVRDGLLGDGIGHIATTSEGRIWAGYFDEGVLGNFGWGPQGPEPIGAPGLVCFNGRFQRVWSFPGPDGGADVPRIGDCCCLNVSGEAAWVCYDDTSSLVRADVTGVTGWRNEGTAGSALLVAESTARVALFSGYTGKHRDRLRIGTLDEDAGAVQWQANRRVVLPDHSPLPRRSFVTGRGSTLHVVAGTDWYQLDLAD